MQIIHNGTDLKIVENKEKSLSKINKMYNLKKNETVFLFVGRIISIKNIFFILDVLKELKERNFKYKMLYVGDGPDFNTLSKKVKEYKMTDDVILTGKILDRELLKEIYFRDERGKIRGEVNFRESLKIQISFYRFLVLPVAQKCKGVSV
jgi:glycosyltransferase involved in cell wall biosynthesis